jgi:hypothetical protein
LIDVHKDIFNNAEFFACIASDNLCI